MKTIHDLSALLWQMAGYTPHQWNFESAPGIGETLSADVAPVPAVVPGSVQMSLRNADVLPDWNVGLDSRACEWVENRHWVYEATIPAEWLPEGKRVRLACKGLDYSGWVRANGAEVGTFVGTHTPHEFDLSSFAGTGEVRLQVIFDCPPRWLGQFGYTSRMTDWKPRYNYTWDWTSRVVQIGFWDDISLVVSGEAELLDVRVRTSFDSGTGKGCVTVSATAPSDMLARVTLRGPEGEVAAESVPSESLAKGLSLSDLPVAAWWPNGFGDQALYDLTVDLVDADDEVHDTVTKRVGFKSVEWRQCEGAPAGADPWICVVNGTPVFLAGVNWTPIRPNFADVPREEYESRLRTYRDMGCTIMRVWGGAFLEKSWFYDLCDEMGLLVWQEFPLSSSGIDNWPPEDKRSIDELEQIARSFIVRRQHHASLLMWCGGNELLGALDGGPVGSDKPVTMDHPLMQRFKAVVDELDPGRRFVETSASGPRGYGHEEDFGKGVHWDVHGPWKPEGTLADWGRYWANDDALFRSEVGSPGASPVDVIRDSKGNCDEVPGDYTNALWRRTSWWIEWNMFIEDMGHAPKNLEEYVEWSQARQARTLGVAAKACRDRFPRCGGFIVWMGHDSFPCTANTAVLDFHGRMKPAARALAEVFGRRE